MMMTIVQIKNNYTNENSKIELEIKIYEKVLNIVLIYFIHV